MKLTYNGPAKALRIGDVVVERGGSAEFPDETAESLIDSGDFSKLTKTNKPTNTNKPSKTEDTPEGDES